MKATGKKKHHKQELYEWLVSLAVASLILIPLAHKFVKEAQALSTTALEPASMNQIDRPLKGIIQGEAPAPATTQLTLQPEAISWQRAEVRAQAKNGAELLQNLGLQGKIVYVVYGRPNKAGERAWGSLEASRTAEESWQLLEKRREAIGQELGKSSKEFALNVLNPVYFSGNGALEDIYVQKALELAPKHQGLVALNFDSVSEAQTALQRLEGLFPKELLAYLAVGLDIQHFPNQKADARSLNAFASWFAEKHAEWAGNSAIPGLVILYTLHGGYKEQGEKGKILELGQLVQYYLPQKTLVIPIFDGYGQKEAKLFMVSQIVSALPSTSEFPALVGIMEFRSKWGDIYDKASVREIFSILQGAPVYFFASQ